MRRTWNFAYLAARSARWLFAVLVMLPAGALIAAFLAFVWLLWLVTSWVQSAVMALTAVPNRDMAVGLASRKPLHAVEGPAGTLSLGLPQRSRRPSGLDFARWLPGWVRSRRHSLVDVQRSLAGMARHGWRKPQVLATLKSSGAAWVWSEAEGAAERVLVTYRPGDTIFERYSRPAARIHLYFDAAGRLVTAGVHQPRKV